MIRRPCRVQLPVRMQRYKSAVLLVGASAVATTPWQKTLRCEQKQFAHGARYSSVFVMWAHGAAERQDHWGNTGWRHFLCAAISCHPTSCSQIFELSLSRERVPLARYAVPASSSGVVRPCCMLVVLVCSDGRASSASSPRHVCSHVVN